MAEIFTRGIWPILNVGHTSRPILGRIRLAFPRTWLRDSPKCLFGIKVMFSIEETKFIFVLVKKKKKNARIKLSFHSLKTFLL